MVGRTLNQQGTLTAAKPANHTALMPTATGKPNSNYQRIYSIVRRIPKGRVATYGQIAALACLPGHARQVGYAMHALAKHTTVPWHRVINAKGEVSRRSTPGWEYEQRLRLEREGVVFDGRGRVDLKQVKWRTQARNRCDLD